MFCSDEDDKAQQLLQILHSLGRGDRCLIFCEMKRALSQPEAKRRAEDRVRSLRMTSCNTMEFQRSESMVIWLSMSGPLLWRLGRCKTSKSWTFKAEAFKSGQSPILCATDVAARGLDIKAGFELNSQSKM